MNDLGEQICRCIVGTCDDTCKYYDAEKAYCVRYGEVAEQAEKAFVEYKKYKNLEKQGKLLKLPCEIGHKVYMIYQFCDEGAWEIEEHKIKLEDLENIGKTVFLTREEVEAALKEL